MTGNTTAGDSSNHQKRRRVNSHTRLSSLTPPQSLFNDSSSADVILRLYENSDENTDLSAGDDQSDVEIYLHSSVLTRSKYFDALLSDRWQKDVETDSISKVSLQISNGSIDDYETVLKLLYYDDFTAVISSVSIAISILPIALELLFEDCVKACVRFIEAVPWTEDEERIVISLVPMLKSEECDVLLARVSPANVNSSDDMLYELLDVAFCNLSNMAFAKAFVAKLLRDYSCKESARRVLNRVFLKTLKEVKTSLEEYSRPDFRVDNNETEAMQRLHLHTAMKNGRNLLWIIERMIELGVADRAVVEWTNQDSLTTDLQRAFRDELWRNIVPALPGVVLRCTSKLANVVVSGSILADRKVRMKLVEDWLPVLRVCKENVSAGMSNNKSLYLELEETFLKITSTLPMSDSQMLLKECLSFSTRNVDDCPHLVTAFNTWFRRAKQPPPPTHPVDNIS
ncbi:BTB/POZ domain-containing protein [Heracleum sosnowskyi]|uniref:BTB/POZ domain-containing protein n=1 Tax=Heracleum sosnowskyi TaxID=360622 RepID=A0AAD8JFB2_9APIA|nr:BTB/POZ domain-containing protein [Heracleum sosnowskyi]